MCYDIIVAFGGAGWCANQFADIEIMLGLLTPMVDSRTASEKKSCHDTTLQILTISHRPEAHHDLVNVLPNES